MIGEYSCGCVQGFESYDCSGEINECLSNPSDPTNTIYLEDLTNSFRCFCNRGHTGKTSAISVTFCVAGLCQCGSYYKDVPGGFRCHCLHGLEGCFCETNIDDCETDSCGISAFAKMA
ncbi:protein eyes shut homolog isoform X3 [Chiloscyllium plagiosum]|uniref:protein eyes shut homolog isoform X3 n=1 Tax=Chiloscyllium plagiosum TaxID=36176 RepID=UPI001CB81365|nr:protein eyes shut homolog isoform X3 [Chiloscyllium plagiosum]